jgi:uncharacterized protein (DUF952 family)
MGWTIYKVLTGEQWAAAEAGDPIRAPVDIADGFVHLSTAAQLQDTLDKWFKGQRGCVLLSFDADDFGPQIRWEPARGGDLFPHVYGDVWASQARSRWPLELGEDGAPLAPVEIRASVGADHP